MAHQVRERRALERHREASTQVPQVDAQPMMTDDRREAGEAALGGFGLQMHPGDATHGEVASRVAARGVLRPIMTRRVTKTG